MLHDLNLDNVKLSDAETGPYQLRKPCRKINATSK